MELGSSARMVGALRAWVARSSSLLRRASARAAARVAARAAAGSAVTRVYAGNSYALIPATSGSRANAAAAIDHATVSMTPCILMPETYADGRCRVYLECLHGRPPPRTVPDPLLRGAVGFHRHPRQTDHAAGVPAGVVALVVSDRRAGVFPARVARTPV